MPEYMRPVQATLKVHLENGETFEATDADLAKFGYVKKADVYMDWERKASEAIGGDIVNSPLNPLRYLLECVVFYPDHFTQFPEEMKDNARRIADLNMYVRDTGYEPPEFKDKS